MHRVQRVPVTESQGRVHTSAAGVLVMPEAEQVDVEIDDNDLRIDVFRSSGPGGQSVNTTDSAVRITHLPTGIVVSLPEREEPAAEQGAGAADPAGAAARGRPGGGRRRGQRRPAQVRTVDRSERIRTYNFAENRISDHRTGYKAYNLDQVLDGDLEPVVDAAVEADLAARAGPWRAPPGARRRGRAGSPRPGVASPEYDAETLLAHVLGVDRARLVASTTSATPDATAYDAWSAGGRPRAAAAPHRHAALPPRRAGGRTGVFVPRPETELLAGWAIERRRSGATPPWSSTCAPARARSPRRSPTRCPQRRVHAVELDEAAHAWAERNLRAPASTCGRATSRRPSTTWPAPSTSWSATRRTSRSRPGSRSRPRPATTTRAGAVVGRRRPRRDPRGRGARRRAAQARGSGRRRARRRAGRVGAGRLRRHGRWARGPRPPRPRRRPGSSALIRRRHRDSWQPGRALRKREDLRRYRRRPRTSDEAIAAAAARRPAGELVVLPTDTVYGIGADAFDPDAVQSAARRQGRGREMPPPVLISARPRSTPSATGVPTAPALIEASGPAAHARLQPAAVLQWDLGETRGTVAVRMPDHRSPSTCWSAPDRWPVSSANLTGQPAANDADQAEEMLGDAVEVIIDDGPSPGGASLDDRRRHRAPGQVLRTGAISGRGAQRRPRRAR